MSDLATLDRYGTVTEPATLTMERLLPGPIERVWAYLTESELRRKWLAAGHMVLAVGASVDFVWRNAEFNDPPSPPPAGVPEENRMTCQITELDPPRRLGITWGSTGGVVFTLEAQGRDVLLTLVHRRVPDRSILLNVSAGWHMHLDILDAVASGRTPPPFWGGMGAAKGGVRPAAAGLSTCHLGAPKASPEPINADVGRNAGTAAARAVRRQRLWVPGSRFPSPGMTGVLSSVRPRGP